MNNSKNKKKLKVLLINAFFHIEGGVDTYVFHLANLLREKGHDIIFFCMDHPRNELTEFRKYFISYVDFQNPMNFWQKLKSIPRLFWSFEANRKITKLIVDEKPDIAHIHNIHYELSPSIIHELKKHNIPIVMTLHDYALVCPLRLMYVKNRLCEKCKNGHFFSVVENKCIRNSYLASFIVYCSVLFHKILRTFSKIDLFISPSRFLADKFKEMEFLFPINILPYCCGHLREDEDFSQTERTIIYFGRLQTIKGIEMLIDAVKGLDVTLKIIGRGPLREVVRDKIKNQNIKNVILVGYIQQNQLQDEIKKCLFTVQPSLWYENYPYSIIESFALGKPVIGSNRGGIPELIDNGTTGLLFDPDQKEDLRNKIQFLLNNSSLIKQFGENARKWVEENLNFDRHYFLLNKAYRESMEKNQGVANLSIKN
ncbi:MAG: glycosyltransferase family 4 protein [Candidatus Omnitrophica bacterium]|nr:glycosyltransferase family 4 protein [Candidatus Omnitrophota bacterium]